MTAAAAVVVGEKAFRARVRTLLRPRRSSRFLDQEYDETELSHEWGEIAEEQDLQVEGGRRCGSCLRRRGGVRYDGCQCGPDWDLCAACVQASIRAAVASVENGGDWIGIVCPGPCGCVLRMNYDLLTALVDNSHLSLVWMLEESRGGFVECGCCCDEKEQQDGATAASSSSSASSASSASTVMNRVCGICFEEESAETPVLLRECCGVHFCPPCLQAYARSELTGKVFNFGEIKELRCPSHRCWGAFPWIEVVSLVSEDVLKTVQVRKNRQHKDTVLALALKDVAELLKVPSLPESVRWAVVNTRMCPRCQVRIYKDGGCDHMVCTMCKADFQWPDALNLVRVPRAYLGSLTRDMVFDVVPGGDLRRAKRVVMKEMVITMKADLASLRPYQGYVHGKVASMRGHQIETLDSFSKFA